MSLLLSRTGAAPGFAPTDLSGLAIWLDAPTLGLSNGAPVASWTDLSGNARTPTQGTAGARPTYTTGVINGLAVVSFDGADDALTFASSIPTTSGFTAFVIVRPTVVANEYAFFNGNGNGYAIGTSGAGTNRELLLRGLADVVGGPYATGVPAIWSAAGNSTSELYINGGVDAVSGTGPAAASGGLVIGAWETGAASHWFGDIGEVIAYDRVLTPAERAAVTRYLSDRWGISEAPEPQPKAFTSTAAATARALAGQPATSRIVRAPAAGSLTAGDVTSSSTFTITADAFRGVAADQAFTSTFGLSVDAVRGAVADQVVTAVFAVTAAADVVPASAPRPPYVVDAPPPPGWGRATRTILLRAPAVGVAVAADVTMASTFAVATDATRGAVGDVTAASTFGVTTTATVDHPADAALTSSFALTVDGFVGAAPVLAPVARVVTASAATAARALVGRPGLALIRRTGPGLVPADAALPFGLGLAADATLGRPGDVAVTEAFTVTADASRGALGDVAVPLGFGLTVSATTGPVAAATITETFAIAAAATRGVAPDLTITETFGITATAVRTTAAAVTAGSTFTLTPTAAVARTGAVAVGLGWTLTVDATVTTGGVTAAQATGGTAHGPGMSAGPPSGATATAGTDRSARATAAAAVGATLTPARPAGSTMTGG